jgi:hypothetical protein
LDPKREILSESGAHSDSIGPKKGNRVRIKGTFGQYWTQKEKSCPNQGHIRTALIQNSGIVSESRVHSDSVGPKKGNRVRIKGTFGQRWTKKGKSCPNQGHIRTALIQNREIVSESEGHSDSIGPKKGNPVRIRGTFGQHRSQKRKSCPNQGFIRTVLDQKREIVSESDRSHQPQHPFTKTTQKKRPEELKILWPTSYQTL